MKRKAKGFLTTGLILFALISCTACFYHHYCRFDRQRWLDAPRSTYARYLMLNDLLKTHPPIGRTKTEIQELLGQPEMPFFLSYPTNTVMIYHLAPQGFDFLWLVLRLDDRGIVTEQRVIHD